MTTRVVLFSDLHLHRWREFAKLDTEGRNDRMMDCATVLDDVHELADANSADAVIFAGDLFHRRGFLATEEFDLAVRGIARIAENFPMHLIPGNHDQATLDGRVHSLSALNFIKGVTVYDVAHGVTIGKSKVLMAPYMESTKALRQVLAGRTWDTAVVHAGIDGAKVGSYEVRPKEDLKPTDFGKLPAGRASIYSGHYHRHQTLADGRLVYVGAPLQHMRSDAGATCGAVVADLDRGTFKQVPLVRPRFITLTDRDISEKDVDEWDLEGNFVDILLSQEPRGGIEKFRKLVGELPARAVQVTFVPKVEKREARLKVEPGMDLVKMLGRYLDQFTPSDLDRAKLDRLAKSFIE